MFKRMLAGLAVVSTMVGAPLAGPFEDGVAAYERGEYGTAFRLWRQFAEQGYPLAQYNLALLYEKGQGIAQDSSEAVKWYRQAAEGGVAAAQVNLAVRYARGEGVARDNLEAAKWYRLAAEQGDAFAQSSLGTMHAAGEGVAQDYVEAAKWFRLGAEAGLARAQRPKSRPPVPRRLLQHHQARIDRIVPIGPGGA